MAGRYYGWSTPYNYLDAYQMQLDTNVLVNGTCLASNDTYDMVLCPSGTSKLPESEIKGLCGQRGLPCPIVSQTALLPLLLLLLLLCCCSLTCALVFICCNVSLQLRGVGLVAQQLVHPLQLTRVHVSAVSLDRSMPAFCKETYLA